MHEIRLPGVFMNDHADRELPSGDVVWGKGPTVLVRCDDATLREIESDARFYAGPDGPFAEYSPSRNPIVRSARKTVAAIAAYRANR
jgi:hypothetical protein